MPVWCMSDTLLLMTVKCAAVVWMGTTLAAGQWIVDHDSHNACRSGLRMRMRMGAPKLVTPECSAGITSLSYWPQWVCQTVIISWLERDCMPGVGGSQCSWTSVALTPAKAWYVMCHNGGERKRPWPEAMCCSTNRFQQCEATNSENPHHGATWYGDWWQKVNVVSFLKLNITSAQLVWVLETSNVKQKSESWY